MRLIVIIVSLLAIFCVLMDIRDLLDKIVIGEVQEVKQENVQLRKALIKGNNTILKADSILKANEQN